MSKNLPRKHFEYRGHECLNCGAPLDLSDKYCHQCGQLNTTKRLALKDFFYEFLSNVISYDSKVWRTITALLFRPGHVTKQYCAGKRSRYANPFRFFLSVSIVFFLIIQLSVRLSSTNDNQVDTDLIKINFSSNEDTSLNNKIMADTTGMSKEEILSNLRTQRDSADSFIQKKILDTAIEEIEKDTTQINVKPHEIISQEALDKMGRFTSYSSQVALYKDYYSNNKNLSPQEALTNLKHRVNTQNIARYKSAIKYHEILSNPAQIINIIAPKAPIFLFFFAPIMSLFFWLIYIRRKFNYMEHMVFNFHLFTLVFLVLYFVALESSLIGTNFIGYIFFLLIGPIYLYKAMRKFYEQSRFKTIVKYLFINFVFLVLLSVTSAIFIVGSVYASIEL